MRKFILSLVAVLVIGIQAGCDDIIGLDVTITNPTIYYTDNGGK